MGVGKQANEPPVAFEEQQAVRFCVNFLMKDGSEN